MTEELDVFAPEIEDENDDIPTEDALDLDEDDGRLGTIRLLVTGSPAMTVPVYGGDTVNNVLMTHGIGGALNVFLDGEEASYEAFVNPGQTMSVFGRAKGG